MDLDGKNALVIGGVSGIGLACVKELLQNGVKKVVIIDYNENLFENVKQEISSEFGSTRINIYKADISKEAELEEAFKKACIELKVIHILHCNSGIIAEDIWRTAYAVNIVGITHALLLGLEHMSKENGGQGGTIIVTSSGLALSKVPFLPIYSATKWALLGLALGYGCSSFFARSGVRVMAMCPGATKTSILYGDNLYSKNSALLDEQLKEFLETNECQEILPVAEGFIYMIKHGSTASVYTIENGKTYEVEMPSVIENTHKLKHVF